MLVIVPDGVSSGDTFSVSTATGAFDVVCPPGVSAGDEIEVELPSTSAEPSAEGDAALLARIADFMEGDERYVQAIESFMAEHCGKVGHYSELRLDELNPQTREFPLEYHSLHHEYQALVEGLLEELLASLGLAPGHFVDTLRRCGAERRGTPAHALLKTLEAIDDLEEFLAMLHEAKLEGEGWYATYASEG